MELSIWAIVGTIGMWCIEGSYLPQLLRLYRLKEARDVSMLFPALNLVGRMFALAYTIHLGEQVLVVGFMLGCLMRATLLWQVVYYRWFYPRAGAELALSPSTPPAAGAS